MNETKQNLTFILPVLIAIVLTLVFAAVLVVFLQDRIMSDILEGQFRFAFLIVGFFASIMITPALAKGLLIQLAQNLYAITSDEAVGFVNRVISGVTDTTPGIPTWRIEEGRADPDGPAVLRKVGGPGNLSIGHDTAVVTSRFGKLKRILGPGKHLLFSFEKVWDVVDLRPQRRQAEAKSMTRDGIPVSCQVEIRFRIDAGGQRPSKEIPYPFSEAAVFKAATSVRHKGDGEIQDWKTRAGGALVGQVNSQLEKYRLDDFLTPAAGAQPLIATIEENVRESIKGAVSGLGVKVEQVQLGPVIPQEDAISRQWLEVWQSEWQRFAAQVIAQGEAEQIQALELARVQFSVQLITGLLPTLQQMHDNGQDIDRQLIKLRFYEVIRSMAEREPSVRKLTFEKGENLKRIFGL